MSNKKRSLTQALGLVLAVGATFVISLLTLPVLEQPVEATPKDCYGCI